MPRRQQVDKACQRCRKRRAKCSGDDPCERCRDAGHACVFDKSRRESKDELRAEIDRLKEEQERKDALLEVLLHEGGSKPCVVGSQGLIAGTATGQDATRKLIHDEAGATHENTPNTVERSAATLDMCPHCHKILSPVQSRSLSQSLSPGTADDEASAGWSTRDKLSTTAPYTEDTATQGLIRSPISGLNPPTYPSPFDERLSLDRIDNWTKTGWTVAHVRQLLESLLSWDYLPFCVVCKDPFLEDYVSGRMQYCSPALVNALLALATRVVSTGQYQPEWQGRSSSVGSGTSASMSACSDGQAFAEEAEALVGDRTTSLALPDTQALGVLALYHVSFGRETAAVGQADEFLAAITTLCLREPMVTKPDENYARVRATAYCGAVSLKRILNLMAIRHAGLCTSAVQDDGIVLDRTTCTSGTPLLVGDSPNEIPDAGISPLNKLDPIPAKLFHLTECVYKILASPIMHAPTTHVGASQIVATYRKCLDWYRKFFALVKKNECNSPFFFFTHMYYQYCLLCLFRPFITVTFKDYDVEPREICLEAAQSIVRLSQSYTAAFGLGHGSPLVSYFVSASGQLSLAVEEAGRGILKPVPSSVAVLGSVAEVNLSMTAPHELATEGDLDHDEAGRSVRGLQISLSPYSLATVPAVANECPVMETDTAHLASVTVDGTILRRAST